MNPNQRNKTINISLISEAKHRKIQGQLYNLDMNSTDEQANNHLSISSMYKKTLHLHCFQQDQRTRGFQKPHQGLRNVSCRRVPYGLFLLYLLMCTNLWISVKTSFSCKNTVKGNKRYSSVLKGTYCSWRENKLSFHHSFRQLQTILSIDQGI